MSSLPRTPKSCSFRHVNRYESSVSCRLVAQITGEQISDCQVAPEVCSQCCRFPLPRRSQLNPVLASLAYRAATQQVASRSVSHHVRAEQTRVFAQRWLWDEQRLSNGDRPAAGTWDAAETWAAAASERGGRPRKPGSNSRPRRIGLVGRSSGFGLAHFNRDLALHLAIDRWLTPDAEEPGGDLPYRVDSVPRDLSPIEIEAWLDGLDVVIFNESPIYSQLTAQARQRGVRVVCIPNWEWLHPGLEWIEHVDLMLCPTAHTADWLSQWQSRFQFDWTIRWVPWPIDTSQFRFRRRDICRRFVYVNGSGGAAAYAADGSALGFRRKGCDVVLAAAELVPDIPIVVYARREDLASTPANIQWRPLPMHNSSLYCDGDVCIQPSRWEGFGLPLLECQAAGLPLITTDFPPMHEHAPYATIPVSEVQPIYLTPNRCIPSPRVEPERLAAVMRQVHGKWISIASCRARRFIKTQHSWRKRKPQILALIDRLIDGSLQT